MGGSRSRIEPAVCRSVMAWTSSRVTGASGGVGAPGGRITSSRQLAGRPSGKKNSILPGQERVGRVGGDAVGLGVGEHERLRIRAALEPDPGRGPHGAVHAVAADHVPRRDLFLAAVVVAQDDGHRIAARGQTGDLDAAFDGDVGARRTGPCRR